jgi:nicotinamidase-related amidase
MNKSSVSIIILMIFFLALPYIYLHSAEERDMQSKKTALLIIDIQDFYFPGGSVPLVNPEPASLNAQKILKKFREKNLLVIHVRHNAKSGAGIHANVKPINGEKVISKDHANSFRDTDLLEYLNQHQVKRIVIVGMQTHMCVEAATRAACDLGFECILVHDACATRALKFNDKVISAEDVHYSTLSTLSDTYSKVIDTKTFLLLSFETMFF